MWLLVLLLIFVFEEEKDPRKLSNAFSATTCFTRSSLRVPSKALAQRKSHCSKDRLLLLLFISTVVLEREKRVESAALGTLCIQCTFGEGASSSVCSFFVVSKNDKRFARTTASSSSFCSASFPRRLSLPLLLLLLLLRLPRGSLSLPCRPCPSSFSSSLRARCSGGFFTSSSLTSLTSFPPFSNALVKLSNVSSIRFEILSNSSTILRNFSHASSTRSASAAEEKFAYLPRFIKQFNISSLGNIDLIFSWTFTWYGEEEKSSFSFFFLSFFSFFFFNMDDNSSFASFKIVNASVPLSWATNHSLAKDAMVYIASTSISNSSALLVSLLLSLLLSTVKVILSFSLNQYTINSALRPPRWSFKHLPARNASQRAFDPPPNVFLFPKAYIIRRCEYNRHHS